MDKVFQIDNKKVMYSFIAFSLLLHGAFLVSKAPKFSIADSSSQSSNEQIVKIKFILKSWFI